jgi:hypothetical protein
VSADRLTPLMRHVLIAIDRGEAVTVEDRWPYTAHWGRDTVTVTVRALRRRDLVTLHRIMEPGWPLRTRLVLTDAGRELVAQWRAEA